MAAKHREAECKADEAPETLGTVGTPETPVTSEGTQEIEFKVSEVLKRPREIKRRIIQLLAALLYNLNLPGFANASIYQGPLKAVCVPGLNCYSCPGAIGACPIGSLQAALGAADRKLPFYLVGTLLAFGALFGRTICGWLCPFGLIQELLDKLPLPKLRKGRWSRVASRGKYVVLAVTVVGIPLGLALFSSRALPFFCAWLCPAGTLEAGIPLVAGTEGLRAILGGQFIWKLAVLIVFIVACLFIYRPFCRFLCPLGALYSFFNRIAVLRYRVDESRCVHCGTCVETCKMDVVAVSDRECIQCGACAGRCEQKAITFTLKDLLQKDASSSRVREASEHLTCQGGVRRQGAVCPQALGSQASSSQVPSSQVRENNEGEQL